MTNLFRQLGLDSDEHAIAEFIRTHQLEVDVRISEAPFWTVGQRQFIAEQLLADATWAITVDQLNESLHEDAVAKSQR
jgi:hypothetical protein